MDLPSVHADSTTNDWNTNLSHDHLTQNDPNQTSTVNSTDTNDHPESIINNQSWEKINSTMNMNDDKAKQELEKDQQHAEDFITKSKKVFMQYGKLN